jgi:glycosyltransferase involved in cell wall biosynthesis
MEKLDSTESLKMLLSAYSCRPDLGSEGGRGWNVAREAAKPHDVWAITRPVNRSAIEAELANDPAPRLHFVYYDLPRWARWGKRQGLGFLYHYYLWQIGSYFVARRLHRKIGFDLAHHVTAGRYWAPSFLALLPVPFLWGPAGGGESAPRAFWKDFGLRGIVEETLRHLIRWLGEHDPLVRLTARRSALALAATEETAARMRRLGAKRVRVFPQVDLHKEDIEQLGRYTVGNGSFLRLISIGRLLHWKGFHLGLESFAEANVPEAEYWLVGDGPHREPLEALARRLGIVDRVRFWGTLSREEALAKLGQCSVLVHPSLHEAGGWVCSEALAAGRPVICLDLGGPAAQVTDETGFRIPANDPDQAVSDIAKAIKLLGDEQDLRKRMGEKARDLILREYQVNHKGRKFRELYTSLATRQD